MKTLTAKKYTENLREALKVFKGNNQGYSYYEGRDGALRLAREYGVGLADYSEPERVECMRGSYSGVCVIFYDLNPPISSKEWVDEIVNQINKLKK